MRPADSANSHERIAWLNRYGSESRCAYSITDAISGLSATLTPAISRVRRASRLMDAVFMGTLHVPRCHGGIFAMVTPSRSCGCRDDMQTRVLTITICRQWRSCANSRWASQIPNHAGLVFALSVRNTRSREMTSDLHITEHEAAQVERANASTASPVVFVHGLWLLPSSWDRWVTLFEQAGYVALT